MWDTKSVLQHKIHEVLLQATISKDSGFIMYITNTELSVEVEKPAL